MNTSGHVRRLAEGYRCGSAVALSPQQSAFEPHLHLGVRDRLAHVYSRRTAATFVEAFLADLRGGSIICTSGKGAELRQGTPFAPMAQLLRTALAQWMPRGTRVTS